MIPIFFTGTFAMWMMNNLTFIPKSVPESRFHILSYTLTAIMAVSGSIVYLMFSKYGILMFPVIIFFGFICGKILINFISYRLFGESYE
jgi:hypothetical protein